MAITYRKVNEMDERDNEPKQKNNLRDEAKRARLASTKLAIDDRQTGYDAARIESIFNQQRAQQEALVQELREMLQELHALKREMENVSHTAQQMALKGATKAQADMVDAAKQSLEKVTKENLRQIDSLVKESQERIKKLKKTTLVERFNPAAIWVTLVIILGMLIYSNFLQ